MWSASDRSNSIAYHNPIGTSKAGALIINAEACIISLVSKDALWYGCCMPMRVAIYARVSTTDQNCAMQIKELREYCANRDWSIEQEYIDEGWSGTKANRPALRRCMADAAKRKFDAVIVWKLDRWGRTVAQLSTDILSLDSAGIRFICPGQGIDTDKSNSMSRLLINILSSFAQFERDVIHERIIAGVKFAQKHGTKSGKPIGRPGKVFDKQAVKDLRLAGLSIRAISQQLDISHGSVQRSLIV